MIALECPNCAAKGSVPNDKVSTRLVCKKCHIVFHMTPTGRPMLGEPPSPVRETEKKVAEDPARAASVKALKQTEWVDSLFTITRTKVAFASLAVGIIAIGCLAVMAAGGDDNLTRKAQTLADAVVSGDRAVAKGLTRADAAEAVTTWFDGVRSQYERLKTSSAGQDVQTNVLVIEENHLKQHGEATLLLITAPPANAKPGDTGITEVPTYWLLDGGSWRIDAARTAHFTPTRP